jgi:HlyD family secretion protein
MKRRWTTFLVPLVAVLMMGLAIHHVVNADRPTPPLAPPITPARAPFNAAIAATGITEAQTENISVGSALSGIVLDVFVSDEMVGTTVKRGDPLFRVDDRRLKAQLAMAEAKLAAAKAEVIKLDSMPRPEELPASLARVATAKANAARVEDEFRRLETLFKRNVVNDQEFITGKLKFDAARHEIEQAEAEHRLLEAGAWEPDKAIARAAVAQAEAERDDVKVEIERTLVRAPVDGEVLQVNIRVGEFVSAQSNQTYVMLGNLKRMHVRADVDENDIARLDFKAPAIASVRGNASETFPLKFVRVEPYVIAKRSLTGDNTERIDTRVLQVIYEVDPPRKDLFVGQQVDVFIEQPKPGEAERVTAERAKMTAQR